MEVSLSPRQAVEFSRTVLDERDYLLSQTGLRAGFDWGSDSVRAVVLYDLDLLAGHYLTTADHAAAGGMLPRSALDSGPAWASGTRVPLHHRPYRAWAGWEGSAWAVRAGRQRNLWSEGVLFTAVDFINAWQPMDPGKDAEAVDSLFLRAGPFALEAVPGAHADTHGILGRAGAAFSGVELRAFGGKMAEERDLVGRDPEHPRLMAGVSGKARYESFGLLVEHAAFNSNLSEDFDRTLVSLSAEVWEQRPAALEYHHNGLGTGTDRYERFRQLRGERPLLGRSYLGLAAGKKPRLRAVWNLGDGSWMVELGQEREFRGLRLHSGFQLFLGRAASEFGAYGHRIWWRLEYPFFWGRAGRA